MSELAIAVHTLHPGSATALLARTDKTYGELSSIEVTDLAGKVMASSRAGVSANRR